MFVKNYIPKLSSEVINGAHETDLDKLEEKIDQETLEDINDTTLDDAGEDNTPNTVPTQTQPTTKAPEVKKPVCENRYTVREGEFKSDKCYSLDDYNDLVYYIDRYNDAVFKYNTAANQANVTCGGFSDRFKELCDEAKDGLDDAKNDKNKYEDKVKDLLNKGTSYSKF